MMRTNRALLPQNAGGSRRTVTRCRAMSHMHLRSIRIAPSRATTALFGTSAVAHVDGLNVNTTLQLQVPCAINLGVLYLSHLRAIGHFSPLHSSLSLSQGPQWTSQLERCARFRVLKVDSLSTLVRFACGLICRSLQVVSLIPGPRPPLLRTQARDMKSLSMALAGPRVTALR